MISTRLPTQEAGGAAEPWRWEAGVPRPLYKHQLKSMPPARPIAKLVLWLMRTEWNGIVELLRLLRSDRKEKKRINVSNAMFLIHF